MNIEQFFNKIFESREVANAYHFRKESHNLHLFLEEYYNTILEQYDELVEVYQGKYGILENDYEIIVSAKSNDNVVEYFEEVAKFVESNREIFEEKDTFIHGIVDNILCTLYKTLYKMKHLSEN